VLLVALNLRGPLIAIAPVVGELRRDLHVGAGTVGLLTSIPVLCFGLAAPPASLLIARTGVHRAVVVSMVGVLLGTLLRSADGPATAIAGTVVMGLGITVGNVVVPVVIGRDFPGATSLVTAAYTAALNVGSTLTSALTAPLAGLVGWRWALAAWALLVAVATAVWTAALRRRVRRGPADDPAPPGPRLPGPPLWRRAAAWGLTIAFAGQAFSYYGATAWLPSLLADTDGLSRSAAGASSSLFQVLAVAGAFAVPALVHWWRRPSLVLLAVTALWAAFPLGLLAAPGWWPLWCSLAGIAQGGGITVLFVAVVRRSRDLAENRRMSALVQGGGYVVAATGPLVVGAGHDVSGGWTVPLLVILRAVAGGRSEDECGPGRGSAGKERRG
jgi:CP family cyanate transporter-like MFS transporter